MRGISGISKLVLTAVTACVISSCGGGDSETIYVCYYDTEYWTKISGPAPDVDITGDYTLSGLDTEWYTLFGNHITSMTADDFTSYSGTLNVGAASISHEIHMSGEVHLTGNWYIIGYETTGIYSYSGPSWTSSTDGYLQDFLFTDMPFSVSGNDLIIEYPLYCMPLEEAAMEEGGEALSLDVEGAGERIHPFGIEKR